MENKVDRKILRSDRSLFSSMVNEWRSISIFRSKGRVRVNYGLSILKKEYRPIITFRTDGLKETVLASFLPSGEYLTISTFRSERYSRVDCKTSTPPWEKWLTVSTFGPEGWTGRYRKRTLITPWIHVGPLPHSDPKC